MSLDYDLRAVKFHQDRKRAQEEAEETGQDFTFWEDGEWDIFESIVFTTMAVDIGEITEDNVVEFVIRKQLWDRVNGYRPSPYVTYENVKKFVGLRTNVNTLDRGRWLKQGGIANALKIQLRDAEYQLQQANESERRISG